MPTMANITVKNRADADVIYVAKVGSAGDKIPAKWTQDAINVVPAFRPALSVATKSNASGTRRIVEVNYAYPVTVVKDGVDTLVDKITGQATISLPANVTYVANEEAAIQLGNLLVSTLLREVFSTGYAPT